MALQAMWVHGSSANILYNEKGRDHCTVQYGWDNVNGLRLPWGVTFRCQDHSSYDFHFAIPTPVIKDDRRAKFIRAFVLFSADPGVTLGSIEVRDGVRQVLYREGLAIGGIHNDFPLEEDINQFSLPHQDVYFGVCLSARFNFTDNATVTLHSAGIDFDI
jgi:hypothetical protein